MQTIARKMAYGGRACQPLGPGGSGRRHALVSRDGGAAWSAPAAIALPNDVVVWWTDLRD